MTTNDAPPATPSHEVPDWLPLLLVSALAAGLLWYASAWGVGVSPDSAEYIAAARRLHSFNDLFALPTQWAPGYPVLLSMLYSSGGDIYTVTRLLQCLLFAGNVGVAMLLLRRLMPRSPERAVLPLIGGGVLLLSLNLWQVNFYAWSEGPFLLCNQLSALVLLCYLQQSSLRLLLGAAALAALGLLFRYAGIAWVGTAALAILLLQPVDWWQRFRNAVIFGLLSIAPFLLWLLINKIVRDETTNREFVVHLVTAGDMTNLLLQFGSWFGLAQNMLIFVVEAALCAAVYLLALRRFASLTQPLRQFVVVSATYIVVYTLFILFSKSFLDAYIPFDDRIFVPAWLFAVLTLLACAQWLLLQPPAQLPRKITIAALAVFAIFNTGRLLPVLVMANEQGMGYLSAYMASLSQVSDVQQLAGKTVYSNAPDYLRMSTDLTIHDYPRKFAPTTQLANPDYEADLATMRSSVQAGTALLVHYPDFEWRRYFPAWPELEMQGYKSILQGRGVAVLSFPTDAAAATDSAPQADKVP